MSINLNNLIRAVFISFLILYISPNAQVVLTKVLDIKYTDLPRKPRVENSGIYLISSFNVQGEGIWLNSFDTPEKYLIKENRLQSISSTEEKSGRPFFYKRADKFYGEEGTLKNESNERIDITIINRNQLLIDIELINNKKQLTLDFPDDLAYADLIGVDKNGNMFLVTENYVNEIPLRVDRRIHVITPEGEILSRFTLPSVKYLYTLNDFQIDAEGHLYVMISEQEGISVYKLTGLTEFTSALIIFPEQFNKSYHYNELVPTVEYSPLEKGARGLSAKTQVVNRLSAVKTGDTYVVYTYSCDSRNLAPANTTAPDGDVVKTPSWLIKGVNAKVPYQWGGFSKLSDFASGLKTGKFAGDINTNGISNYAVGVDCSGFVSRCWGLGYHSTTRDMPSITYKYSSWDQLRPGDAILKTGHVRMFVDRAKNGAFRIVEASARDWGVSYWTYLPSDLTEYVPLYPKGMAGEYSTKQPLLKKVRSISENSSEILWTCDSTKIKGYRLYKSIDGINWSMVQDTNSLKNTSATVTTVSRAEFFRVASVQDSSSAESNWSNVLGTGRYQNSKKALVVDGFERETGGWRGNGNNFAMKYGKALSDLQMSFDMIRNKQLEDSTFSLMDYNIVFWMLGDESTIDITFSPYEQKLISAYLEKGGSLFVSGSDVGYDLFANGSMDDKLFFNNYLKAGYVNDNALSKSVSGIDDDTFAGLTFTFGQTYEAGRPDEIKPFNGSTVCMRYSNNKTAGLQYAGIFGTSEVTGRVIYLGFPLETTANDTNFNQMIKKAVEFFTSELSNAENNENISVLFSLSQNYPNPFNPTTKIDFSVGKEGVVSLKVYNLLGEEVRTLVNGIKKQGRYSVNFEGNGLSSGIYYYVLKSGDYKSLKKMILIK